MSRWYGTSISMLSVVTSGVGVSVYSTPYTPKLNTAEGKPQKSSFFSGQPNKAFSPPPSA